MCFGSFQKLPRNIRLINLGNDCSNETSVSENRFSFTSGGEPAIEFVWGVAEIENYKENEKTLYMIFANLA